MNRIITDRVKALRALGRQSLSGHWQEVILFTFVCHLIMQAPALIYNSSNTDFDSYGILASVLNLYTVIISGPVTLSLISFFMKAFRQEGIGNFSDIKYGFGYFSKALALYVRILVFTWLWSMLFIIPGIIAAINYSQAFFILADDPSKSTAQCLKESKFIMQGNKLKYCELYLSFVGWYMLASIPSMICHWVLDGGNLSLAITAIENGATAEAAVLLSTVNPLAEVLLLLTVAVDAYVYSARAAFFDILVGNLVIKSVDDIDNEAL